MPAINGRFITPSSVTGTNIRLKNNEALRALNAAGSSDVALLLLTALNNLEFQQLPYANSSLAIPSQPKQFATLEYIANYVVGKTQAKDAVQAYTTTNQALTGSLPFIVDGYTFVASTVKNPRICLNGQATGSANGVYDYTDNGTTYTLSRSPDFDGVSDPSGLEVTSGVYFIVENGTVYSGYEVQLTTANPITVNTTTMTFVAYPSALSLVAGDMLSKTGNTFAVNLASLSGLKSTNPGVAGGQLMVKTDPAASVKDQTTRIDPSTGALMGRKFGKVKNYSLTSTDIANGYYDLSVIAAQSSVQMSVAGGGFMDEDADFSVNYTGGAGGNTRITWINGLATGGVSALIAGDVVSFLYSSY